MIYVCCKCVKKTRDNNLKLITLSHNDKYKFIINTLRLKKSLLPIQAYHFTASTKFQFNDKKKENKKLQKSLMNSNRPWIQHKDNFFNKLISRSRSDNFNFIVFINSIHDDVLTFIHSIDHYNRFVTVHNRFCVVT